MHIARLVRTNAIWVDWDLDLDSCERYGRLLHRLIGDHDPTDQRWLGTYRPIDDGQDRRTVEWCADRATIDARLAALRGGLETCVKTRPRHVLDALNAVECQVLLGPSAVRETLLDGTVDPDASLCVVVDVTFQRSRLLKSIAYHCNLRLSTWNGWPLGPTPPAERSDTVTAREISDETLTVFRDGTDAVRRGFSNLLRGCFDERDLSIYGRDYRPPQFFIAVPQDRVSPSSLLAQDARESLLILARRFLDAGHVDDTSVAVSVVKGELVALRRFVPRQRERIDEPSYVIVPTWRGGVEQGASGSMLRWGRRSGATEGSLGPDDQHVHPAIRAFTELERHVADDLLRLSDDTKLYEHHVDVYGAIAYGVGRLWDALAMHLPTSTGGRLERVHSAVQLLHEILLQGVADLAEITSQIGRTRAEHERVQATLGQRYERAISERPGSRNQTIGTSMVQTGHFLRLDTTVKSVRARALRVRDSYSGLLEAMNKAFDERRARESDVLERSSFQLGRALAFLAIVTVIDFAVRQPEWRATWAFAWRILFYGVAGTAAVGLFATVLHSIWRARIAGRIMPPPFSMVFGDAHLFVRRLSSQRLDDIDRGLDPYAASDGPMTRGGVSAPAASMTPAEVAVVWKTEDRSLTDACAALWDRAAAQTGVQHRNRAARWLPDRPRLRRAAALMAPRRRARWLLLDRLEDDMADIERRIRMLSVQALLATERPRRLDRYPLLELSCLYRYVHRCGTTSRFLDQPLLSDAEWRRVVACHRIEEHVGALENWIDAQTHRPATAGDLRREIRTALQDVRRCDPRRRPALAAETESADDDGQGQAPTSIARGEQ